MKTLKLFNAVIQKESKGEPFISDQGFVIEPGALWAKQEILSYYLQEKLNGQDINKSFHKSWLKIQESSRFELFVHQIMHYISTYGSNFKDEIYIPDEVLDIPGIKIIYKVIKAYSKDEMKQKCLSLLQSGIALEEKTIEDVLTILVDELNYQFTGEEGIRNKEAIIKIADLYGIFPVNTMEFFRYIIYRATGSSLLIKNEESVIKIKESGFNPTHHFKKFGLEKLAEIFNRFKPLFLAFKPKCKKTINRISKLSKKYHKPMIFNPLNNVTNALLEEEDFHWMKNATPFALFKALSACYTRMNGQNNFVYRIRNGKSWTEATKTKNVFNDNNYKILMQHLKERFAFGGKTFYFPDNIIFALPTSEKMFVGNIPVGTKFQGERLAIGIYWKNSWGAHDLDLSGINIFGKVGWNADYNQCDNLFYSGDITLAPNGAVEYLYANKNLIAPTLIKNNVYSGKNDCKYKIIIGKGDKIDKKYMMNSNNLFVGIECQSIQKQTILGILLAEKNNQSFVLLNLGAGHTRISGDSEISRIATKALYQQWNNPPSLNRLIEFLGGVIVKEREKANYDFSLDVLEKDTIIKLFT